MKIIQYILVCIAIFFSFTVLHNNLINDAISSISNLPETQSNDHGSKVVVQEIVQVSVGIDKPIELIPISHDRTLENTIVTINGMLDHGDTFDSALRRDNIPVEIRSLIISSLSDTLDFKRLKPSDRYTLQITDTGKLDTFRYHSGPLDSISITNSYDGYIVKKDPVELERQRVHVSGVINSSLFGSFTNKNENIRLVYAFADIFASKIDFNTEVRKGDRYSFVVDKYYKNGELVGYGKIQTASYEFAKGLSINAYYYLPSDEKFGSYFDESGQAVGTSFLRSPLPFGRVSSKFSYRRKHPVTGVVKPHLGIDLAAPYGTPIMAAADGTVLSVGRNGGNGNQIVLSHAGGYKTYYGHLSRFKRGLRRGDLVHKKAIIGYVGSTGISTGPHLDYRIRHNNTFKNPFSIEFKPKVLLSKVQLRDFFTMKNQLLQPEITPETYSNTVVLQVSHLTLSSSRQLTLL